MHVTGSYYRLFKFFSQLYDSAVDILKFLYGVHRLFIAAQHKLIIAQRLDFQIIIKFHDSGDFLLRLSPDNRTVQFPRFAGGSQQQPLPVFYKFAFGHSGPFVVICQMGQRHQTVQIYSADIIGCQYNGVIGRQFFYSVRINI